MIDYKLGQVYRVSTLQGRRKTENKITGELIHHNEKHFTLQSKRGVRESFLKIDLKIREYGIKVM